MSHYHERYLEGAYEQVWQELSELGAAVYEPAIIDDATAVARTIVERARHNIHILIERLPEIGYQFGYFPKEMTEEDKQRYIHIVGQDYDFYEKLAPDDPIGLMMAVISDEFDTQWVHKKARLHRPPPPTGREMIETIEETLGQLPLIVKVWYEEIGEVSFCGHIPHSWIATPPHSSHRTLDPLYVVSLEHILSQKRYEPRDGGYDLFLSPPEIMKCCRDDMGGYAIHVPAEGADCPFDVEWERTTFVGYLRACFRDGGIAGLRDWAIPSKDFDFLTQDLLPL